MGKFAEELILSSGGEPVFKGYKISGVKKAYPASLCVSVNDEIVHGIPSKKRILKEGDVVGLDMGMRWPSRKITNHNPSAGWRSGQITNTDKGLITDMAVTVGVGKISKQAEKLLRVTKESLDIAISVLKPGIRLGDLGFAVQNHLEKNGFGVIRELAGHGVGNNIHEDPLVLNYGEKGKGMEITEGMVLALEPMATLGDWHIKTDSDQWTIRTKGGSLAAHFEHTVVITKDGAEVLTGYKQ